MDRTNTRRAAWTVVALGLVGVMGAGSPAPAQVSYPSAAFESVGYAWTDAGDEYAFSLAQSDELNEAGDYSFARYGQAPGYNSSASVGVEHESSLRDDGFSLGAEAYAYVSDDYGYAACSAWSEAWAGITFELDAPSEVVIGGVAYLRGSSSPTHASLDLELRGEGGILLRTLGAGGVAWSGKLASGTYTLTASASVTREIDFSGGDVYEWSRGGFEIEVRATPLASLKSGEFPRGRAGVAPPVE